MSEFLIFVLSMCDQPETGINRNNCLYKYERCLEDHENAIYSDISKEDFCTSILGKYVTKKVRFCIEGVK